MIAWESPRTYLLVSKKGYVTFVEPGQKLRCTLRFFAPLEPGRYVAQIDIVQELVEWFSRHDADLPRINIHVRVQAPAGRYVVNGPAVVHNTVGQETIILNANNGAFYTANPSASAIWNALVDGYDIEQIVAAFSTDHGTVQQFVSQLLEHELLVAADGASMGPPGTPGCEGYSASHPPRLTKHARPDAVDISNRMRAGGASEDGHGRRPDQSRDC